MTHKGSVTRVGLVDCLYKLSDAGLLNEPVTDASTRAIQRAITQAASEHSSKQTPYGPVLQHLDLGVDGLRAWEYANPFA